LLLSRQLRPQSITYRLDTNSRNSLPRGKDETASDYLYHQARKFVHTKQGVIWLYMLKKSLVAMNHVIFKNFKQMFVIVKLQTGKRR
jgi:hypothetical protein